MTNSPFFEEVPIGAEIPVLEKYPTPRQLVMYAGASGDYNNIHYDRDAAAAKGLPGIVVHGQLVSACLMQMLTDWLGAAGVLKKYSVSYKAMTFPGEKLLLKGTIAKKSESGDWFGHAVDLGGKPEGGENGGGDGGGAVAAAGGLVCLTLEPLVAGELHAQEAVALFLDDAGRLETGLGETFLSPEVILKRP